MNKEQAELIKALAEIIAMIADEPESYSVEYIQDRYLFNLATKD